MQSHHRRGKRNKKGFLSMQQIIVIVLATVAFMIILEVSLEAMTKMEDKSKEQICRTSIAARERATIEKFGMEFETVPLLCQTQDKEIPYSKVAKPDDVKKNVADLMARCWWMFGEGQAKDILEDTIGGKNACFMCYTLKTEKTDKFTEPIPAEEILDYMMDTPYKVTRDDDNCKDFGGHCVESKNDCDLANGWEYDADNKVCKSEYKNKKHCCHSRFSCINKGGKCFNEGSQETGWHRYNEWSCPANQKCYIADEHFYSYVDYIQSWAGPGMTVITTDIEPGKTYAITYGEDNQDCGSWCKYIGGAGGVAGAIGGAIVIGSGPVGWTVGAVVGGIAAYVGTYAATNKGVDIVTTMTERDLSTIYLTTIKQTEGHCNMNYGLGDE